VSARVFALITRGMTDKTAVCVFPWELPILQLIHGGGVEEVQLEDLNNVNDGAMKIERLRFKKRAEYPGHIPAMPLDLRAQLEVMQWVDPDEDPANDPMAEYGRLAEKYGMDKELPLACVTRVYGEFNSGAFEAKVKEFGKISLPKPTALRARDEGLGKSPNQMSVSELRIALSERAVEWTAKDNKQALVEKLSGALVE
jgi:hypothetical protein